MIEKKCIIIDDKPQNATIDEIINTLKKDGIKLTCIQLNPKLKVFRKNIGTEDVPIYAIDIDEILKALNSHDFFRKRVDLIVCDYDLEDRSVNGFEIISALRRDNYNNQAILYSGTRNTVVKTILAEEDEGSRLNKLTKLFSANIKHFTDRDEYRDVVVGSLKKETFSQGYFIEKLLGPYSEMIIKSIPSHFEGWQIKDILKELQSESQAAIVFQKEIIEFAISNVIDFNADDK